MRTLIAASAFLAAIAVVFLYRCQGPRPAIGDVRLERGATGWRVSAEMVNQGHGDGQVEVTFRVVDEASGRSWQGDRRVALGPHERVELSEWIDAPEAPAGRCAAKVQAQYPPR